MTAKDLLLYLLEYTYEKEGAYPPLTTALAGVTAAQASWKPAGERHSIWQIVRHMPEWIEEASSLESLALELNGEASKIVHIPLQGDEGVFRGDHSLVTCAFVKVNRESVSEELCRSSRTSSNTTT